MNGYIEMDVSAFIKGLDLAAKEMKQAAERGMAKAVLQLMDDTIEEYPGIPQDEHVLRASGSAFVNNRLVGTSNDNGIGQPIVQSEDELGPNKIVGAVIFGTPYAAYQHEGVRYDGSHVVKNYTTAGTGPKFLESKLFHNTDKYLGIIAEEIANA